MSKGLKTALIVTGIVLIVLSVVSAVVGMFSGWRNGGWNYGWGMMGPGIIGGFGFMGLMGIFWAVVLGLIIWALVAAVRGSGHDGRPRYTGGESAQDILKKRYARGEINKAEFDEKMNDLM